MRKITPYTAAAVLILSRLYSYALFIPGEQANAGITAAACLLSNGLKLLLFLPLIFICKRDNDGSAASCFGRRHSTLLLLPLFAALVAASAEMSALTSEVYPDRVSSLSIPIIWFGVCAYTASMGMTGVSRSAGLMVFAFTAVIMLTFIGMRISMETDRIYIFSENRAQLLEDMRKLWADMYDIPILLGLLPYLKEKAGKSIGIYLTFDSILSLVTFFMYAAVLGDFKSKAGYSVFTLFSCTKGTLIDRSDGIFTAIACSCGMVTCAMLLIMIKDCMRTRRERYDEIKTIGFTAAFAALPVLLFKEQVSVISGINGIITIVTGVLMIAVICVETAKKGECVA